MREKNIILAGLGPHARRIYYPLLEKYAHRYNLKLRLLVELQDQQENTYRYLSQRTLQPETLFFLDNSYRNNACLQEELRQALDETVSKNENCSIIISTEAKAHLPYLTWAVDRNIDVLMDKPISAPMEARSSLGAAQRIFEDYLEIEQRLKRSCSNVIVQCQRRSHEGYQFINAYLTDFLQKFQIPISFLDIYHGDGMWCMPPELFQRENHPYKYGYGKLMHSGYHFIDLFAWLMELNNLIELKRPSKLELFVKSFRPYDFLHQINETDYERLFQTDRFRNFFGPDLKQQAKTLGELDVFILGQLKREEVVVTTASINLQQNSFSRRAWVDPPPDVYKGNGRIRHERVNIQVANLLNIQVHSYQSYETGRQDSEIEGAGHEDHFDIYIFRNSAVVGGTALEKFSLGEATRQTNQDHSFYLGHNEKAREVNFLNFLEGKPGTSSLVTQYMTNRLLSLIYECLVKESNGDLPHICVSL